MTEVFDHLHFVDIIIAVFEKKLKRNGEYSKRAFARDLGLSASLTNRILERKSSLTLKTVEQIALKLKLSKDETRYFIELHQASKTGDYSEARRQRENYHFSVTRKKLDGTLRVTFRDIGLFLKISLNGGIIAAHEAARYLHREPEECWASCERLTESGYLIGNRESGWKTNLTHVLMEDGDTEAKKHFHINYLMLVIDALFTDPTTRYFHSSQRTFKKADFEKICRSIDKFMASPELSPSAVTEHDMVYLLGMQFIPFEEVERVPEEFRPPEGV